MKRIIRLIAASFAALALSSCTLEFIDGELVKGGTLTLSLGLDEEPQTRAAMTESELLNTASVKIYMADYSGLIRQYSYSSIPESIYLPADSYRVDVEAGESVKSNPSIASWDQKSYKGSTEFSVTAGSSTDVKVIAKVHNAVTKVSFDSSVGTNFASGYCLTIGTSTSDSSQQLDYISTRSGREGYFIVGNDEPSLYWSFDGKLKSTGKTVSKSGEIKSVEPGKTYVMTLTYSVTDGTVGFTLMVDDTTDDYEDVIVFEPVSTGVASIPAYEIWAGHVTLHADVDESEYSNPSAVKFAYSADGRNWTTVAAVRNSEGVYSAFVNGLNPSTTYSYKLVIAGEDIGAPGSFTTEAAPQLPNAGFEYTSNNESSSWTSFYDPSASDPDARTKWWDNGSSASAGMLGSNYAICYSDTDVPSGIGSSKSAKLTSISAAGKLAAGNLFSGEFAGLDGLNGKVNFGRPWSSRPTAVRFWYKYKGGKVDKAGGPSSSALTTSDYDKFQIKVAVGTWDYRKYGGSKQSPVQVNTSDQSTFWDYNTIDGTVAYGQITETGNGNTGSWKQVTIPLDYKSETEYPSYIVFSAAASAYGDYFAGSSSSILWIDEIELLYE